MSLKEYNVNVSVDIQPMGTQASDETLRLLDAAKAAAAKAYAPYSKFHVGAALLFEDGQIFAASNQENAAYPSGLCAERVTLFYANAQRPDAKVLRILIYAENEAGPVVTPITPCGACRQVLLEKESVQGSPIAITLAGANALYHIPAGVTSLLPLSFVPESLEGK